ncbi:two-component sensor histidine kinase, partial [bacterium]|nr:two-component sensor histidine kinase [bacterium]
MTRLFFRFYVGIVAILVVAWIVQAYIADLPTTQNVSVVEDALAGGVRLARDHVANIWDEETSVSASKYKQVASKFKYPMIPIAFSNADWLDEPYRQRLLE